MKKKKKEPNIESDANFNAKVRSRDKLARIEVDAEHIQKLPNPEFREKIINELKYLGFIYLTIDLEGYRTGSHNEVLTAQ
jgi:uncharacterized protein